MGVSSQYAQMMRMGRRADPAVAERHARFAAALAVNELMGERSVSEVVERWGRRDFVSSAGAVYGASFALPGMVSGSLCQRAYGRAQRERGGGALGPQGLCVSRR